MASFMCAILSCSAFPVLREKLVPHPHRVCTFSLVRIHFHFASVIRALSKSERYFFSIWTDISSRTILWSVFGLMPSVTMTLFPAQPPEIMIQEISEICCSFHFWICFAWNIVIKISLFFDIPNCHLFFERRYSHPVMEFLEHERWYSVIRVLFQWWWGGIRMLL